MHNGHGFRHDAQDAFRKSLCGKSRPVAPLCTEASQWGLIWLLCPANSIRGDWELLGSPGP